MLSVIVLMASCENFLDVNEDPNNPVSVTPDWFCLLHRIIRPM